MMKINRPICCISLFISLLFLLLLFRQFHHNFTLIITNHDCQLSRLESDDFFCETDADWLRRKDLFAIQHRRNKYHDSPYLFFQDNYEPTFSCRFEQRLGINGDGGKWICDVYRLKQTPSCLIYSLGSNGEFSFENETKRTLPHCDIHTFDMRDFNCTKMCTFHKMKIADGVLPGTKNLRMVMSELNHSGRELDILKIDVEGSEYEFFEDLLHTDYHLSENIRQILVEFHFGRVIKKVNNITTYEYPKLHRLFELFHQNHFVIFHKEVNLFNPYHAFEFSFIRLNRRFFQNRTFFSE